MEQEANDPTDGSIIEVQRMKLSQADMVNTQLNAKILDLQREKDSLMKAVVSLQGELDSLRQAESIESSE